MGEPLRILIADDHPIVRSGLGRILGEAAEIVEIGEAGTTQEVLDLARASKWDVIILDLGLPGRGGLDVLKELTGENPNRPVLVLSMHAEQEYAVRVLRAGAAGYLTKETATSDTLIEAVRKVAKGGRFISATVAEQLAVAIARDTSKPSHATLSDREYEVLRLIASGKTVGDIAGLLSLSVKTVSSYRARILEKMNLHNNAELMKYAIEHRLVDDSYS